MPPKLLSDDKQNVVIRPMAYCKEQDLAAYAEAKEFPIIRAISVARRTTCSVRRSKACCKRGSASTRGVLRPSLGPLAKCLPPSFVIENYLISMTYQIEIDREVHLPELRVVQL